MLRVFFQTQSISFLVGESNHVNIMSLPITGFKNKSSIQNIHFVDYVYRANREENNYSGGISLIPDITTDTKPHENNLHHNILNKKSMSEVCCHGKILNTEDVNLFLTA
jgi:hypothetical protein